MEVKQIYSILNDVTKEVLGQESLIKEDLSNIVELGEAFTSANKVDNYVRTLIDVVGRYIFSSRVYKGSMPSIMRDGWEFGALLEKVRMSELPEATENESWELEDKTSYDPNIFYKPKVTAKFYNGLKTYEIPVSFTEKQVKSAFTSADQMNKFLSMIFTAVENSLVVKNDALVQRTINAMIGETMYDLDNGGTYTGKSGIRAVNLLHLYNSTHGTSLTRATAMKDADFLREASETINLYKGRMKKMSKLFNIGGAEKFTTDEYLHVVVHGDFESAVQFHLQSNTWNENLVALPNYETVPYWQGSGTTYAFDETSEVKIKTPSGHDVDVKGVVAVMFDRDALAVNNFDKRVTSNYNPKAEFYTNWYKCDAQYIADTDENFVVFYIA